MKDVAWNCRKCGRVEADVQQKWHEVCGTRMRRCSRYEWFLADALARVAVRHPISRSSTVRLYEQYRVPDHRGFYWYWDVAVKVEQQDVGYLKSAGFLIDVNGRDHDNQAVYSGPGGCGMTRDDQKRWEVFGSENRMHKSGWDTVYLTNEECRKAFADTTAARVFADLVSRCYWFEPAAEPAMR